MLKVTSIVIASLIAASSAWAAPAQFSVTLAKPLEKAKDVIVESNLFRCEGTTCSLVSKPIDAASVTTCRKLAREVGEITAYGTGAAPFDAEKLTRCNAK